MVLLLVTFAGYLLPAVAVLGLWFVEIDRVIAGVSSWQIAPLARFIFAVVVVSAYIGLLFRRAMLKDINPEPEYKPSLRLFWQKLNYQLGRGADWQPQTKSQVTGINRVILLTALVIIWLGTLGALNNQLAIYDQWWLAAVVSIFSDTALMPFAEMIGGAAASAVLLVVLHYFVDLAYQQYGDIMPDSERADFFGLGSVEYQSTESDLAEIAYIKEVIARKKSLND